MIGSFLIWLQNSTGNPRGKQRALILADRMFGPFVAETADGLKLRVFPSSSMDASYFDRRSQVALPGANPARLIAELPSGGTFVDVGANIGYLALLASRRLGPNGRVYAFEPSMREFHRLLDNLRLNDADNVVPFSIALSDRNGILTLSLEPYHTGLNHLEPISVQPAPAGLQRQLTGALKLDDVLPSSQIPSAIDLVKIDVEGAELRVLHGMQNLLSMHKVLRLCIEITPDFLRRFGDSRDDLFRYLSGMGYRPRYDLQVRQYDEIFELA
jgi:FkbM family methyltransferase